jgi:3-deoxy-D-manno-octulosonate 8-phosphate phosphatase KdsC-like HAD superfamily phosphatase
VLRKLNKPAYILSTEKNPVVTARAKKIEVPVFQGKGDKVQTLRYISDEEGLDLKNVLYTGNDINDYKAMQLCGYKACPSDSHKVIKQISTIALKTKGGFGVVRELLEDVFGLDFIEILYKE